MQPTAEPTRHQGIALLLLTRDEDFATVVLQLLRTNGYQVSVAPTAEDALSSPLEPRSNWR